MKRLFGLRPNGGPSKVLIAPGVLGRSFFTPPSAGELKRGAVAVTSDANMQKLFAAAKRAAAEERPARATKSGDDAILQTYLDNGGRNKNGVRGYARKEAESTWSLFKSLTGGKPLAKCTRNDGRLLVKLFRDDFRAKHGGEMKARASTKS